MTRVLVTVALSIQVGAAVLAAQGGDTGRTAAFVSGLAQALSKGDRAAVADMVRYPLNASVGGIAIPIANRSEMLRLYSSVFTAELRCLVDDTVAKGAAGVRVDAGGATFADGHIHAAGAGGDLKITNISVPPVTGVAAPPNPAPRRVTLRRGDTQFAGRLYGDGVDVYIISARKGDVVQARIEQFPGRSAAIRVVQENTGKVLDRSGSPAPRIWNGTIQEAGNYRVEVVRLASYCQPSFTYLLTISLK